MIKFNNPIRPAGIRKMIRNVISKSFGALGITVKKATASLRYLAEIGADLNINFQKLYEVMKYNLLIIKIARRIRIFEFINRGILKLWIGG